MAPQFFSSFSMAPQLLLFFHISSNWVKIRLYIENQLPRLSESSPFFIFLHISSTWVKIRLYTKNQLPRLPGSFLKVHGGWVGEFFIVLCILIKWGKAIFVKCFSTMFNKYCLYKHHCLCTYDQFGT